jgi:hypothetical protein
LLAGGGNVRSDRNLQGHFSIYGPDMNEASPPSTLPVKRRSWAQFGMRSLLILIAFAAVAAWFAKAEMAKEQRREELLTAVQQDFTGLLTLSTKATWQRRLGAWLRGKPPTMGVETSQFQLGAKFPIMRDFVEMFPDGRHGFRIANVQSMPELRNLLPRVKSLHSVEIDDPIDPSDETLAWLGRLPIKEQLTFSVRRLDDDLLRRMAQAKVDPSEIVDLGEADHSIAWALVTDEGLQSASAFRKLSRLTAGQNGSDQGFAKFRGHPKLAGVELVGRGYTDASGSVLTTLPSLSWLKLCDTQLSDGVVAEVISKKRLYTLALRDMTVGEKSIAAIEGTGSLSELTLKDVPITPELVAAFAKNPIDILSLEGDYTDDDVKLLAPIAPTLGRLALRTPKVTDDGLAWLAKASSLQTLQLFDTQLTAAAAKLIKTKMASFYFYLSGKNISVASLPESDRAFQLSAIMLFGSEIDDDDLALLEPPYSSLYLTDTRVTARGLRSLKMPRTAISVILWFDQNAPPPLTPGEIEEIKQEFRGLVGISLKPTDPAVLKRMVPKSSRTPATDEDSP